MAIRDGALLGKGLGAFYKSNIRLVGGVLGISADFYRGLGDGPNRIQWEGSGGFAAYGGTHNVMFTNQDALLWGRPNGFVADDQELRFGHYTATGTVRLAHTIDLGQGQVRTIRIERGSDLSRADVLLGGVIGSSDLWLVGDGRIDLSTDSSYSGAVSIYGAELRLNRGGRIPNVSEITLSHGGTLYLDDWGTHDSDFGGAWYKDRIGALINLGGGRIAHRRSGAVFQKVGKLNVTSGHNSIQIFDPKVVVYTLHLKTPELVRAPDSRSTLHMVGGKIDYPELWLDISASGHNVNDAGGAGVIPWATIEGRVITLAQAITLEGDDFHRVRFDGAETNPGGWNAGDNMMVQGEYGLTQHRTINSLITQFESFTLNLKEYNLTINSGGLANNTSLTFNGRGLIRTALGRPLYVHAKKDVVVSGRAQLADGMDLVKTLPGTLFLRSSVTHEVGSVYIHRGMLDLQAGRLQLRAEAGGRITVGDGGGSATLQLAPDRWDQILIGDGKLPSITLNGTPYDPRGPEYGGAQAILQMGGNTKLHIANLHIENRGTIDWVGGEASAANILWIDSLTFSGPDAQLFMRNWYEYEDILLVRKAGFNTGYLGQIVFDGYQNYETTYRQWDKDYWQITPFGHLALPEPSTYGALLGALGTGLYLLRRSRRRKAATQ